MSQTTNTPNAHRVTSRLPQPQTAKQTSAEHHQQYLIDERRRVMRRPSAAPRSIADVVYAPKTHRSNGVPTEDYEARQLRRRGGPLGKIGLELDRLARSEADPERALKTRMIAFNVKDLAGEPPQFEFNFRDGGNFSIGYEALDTFILKLMALPRVTPCQRHEALAFIPVIGRWLRFESHECWKSVRQLAAYGGLSPGHAGRIVKLLERVGVIRWVKPQGAKVKIFVVNPEAIYRGGMDSARRSVVMDAYRKAISPQPSDEPPSDAAQVVAEAERRDRDAPPVTTIRLQETDHTHALETLGSSLEMALAKFGRAVHQAEHTR